MRRKAGDAIVGPCSCPGVGGLSSLSGPEHKYYVTRARTNNQLGYTEMDTNNRLDISPEYDADSGTYVVRFDSDEYELSTMVVLAVAAVSGRDPLTLPALNDCLDPTCLDGLFAPKENGTPRTGGCVTFEYIGYEVTADSRGEVVLDPLED